MEKLTKKYIVWNYLQYENWYPTQYDTLEEVEFHLNKMKEIHYYDPCVVTEFIRQVV